MKLVQNERTKLVANACDRASTSCLTVGIVAPLAGHFYGLSQLSGWRASVVSIGWLVVALGFHFIARRVLERLEE